MQKLGVWNSFVQILTLTSMKRILQINKNQLLLLASLLSAFTILLSCASDSEDQIPNPPPGSGDCATSTASLSNDVLPIVQQNCAVAGCHVSGTGRANFTDKNVVIQFASQIRTNTSSGVMPPPSSGKSLTEAEKKLISCWVQNGAKDN